MKWKNSLHAGNSMLPLILFPRKLIIIKTLRGNKKLNRNFILNAFIYSFFKVIVKYSVIRFES